MLLLCRMKLILTHCDPDLDAIVSAWLAQRFIFADEPSEVRFVSAITERIIASAHCIVDVGKIHNRKTLRFDHKGVECLRHVTCSAKLVWRHLRKLGLYVEDLEELLELVHDGDSMTRRSEKRLRYFMSCRVGVHAKLKEVRAHHADDGTVYKVMADYLDEQFGSAIRAMKRAKSRTRPSPYDYRKNYARASVVLRACGWQPAPGEPTLPSFKVGSPARREIEALAAIGDVPWQAIRDDVILATQIEHILAVCREAALPYLLGDKCPLTRKKIQALSGYAAPRMKGVMGRLLRGSIDVAGNPPHWFDTHCFEDVLSRLQRARGMLLGQAERWSAAEVQPAVSASDIEMSRVMLERVPSAIRKLQELTRNLPEACPARNGGTPTSQQNLNKAKEAESEEERAEAMMRLRGEVAAACGLIEKNIFELRSRHFCSEHWPTPAQKRSVYAELSKMMQSVGSLTSSPAAVPIP